MGDMEAADMREDSPEDTVGFPVGMPVGSPDVDFPVASLAAED